MADALGLASSIIAVAELLVKVGVQCSTYCSGLKNARRDARQILNEADRFSATLKDLERLLSGPSSAKLRASRNLRRSILDCHLQLSMLFAKLEQGTRLQKITWPLKKGEISGIISKLQTYRSTIALDLQVDQRYATSHHRFHHC